MNETSSRLFEESPERIASRLMQKVQNKDGLTEIATGLILLTFAGLYGLQLVFQPGSPVYKASSFAVLAMMMLIAIPIFGSQWVIKKVRMRYLIGKVGYVKLKPINRVQTGWLIVVAAVAAVVAAAVAGVVGRHLPSALAVHESLSAQPVPSSAFSWILAGDGIAGGLLACVGGRSVRYFIAGGLFAVIGIVLALGGTLPNVGMTILFGFMGLFCLASGSIALSTLLRERSEPAE